MSRNRYRRVTIDVARRAGVGKGTVYLHWASKLELFATVLIRDAAEIVVEQLSTFRVDPAEIRLHRTAWVALEELTARDRALPVDGHYQRGILGPGTCPCTLSRDPAVSGRHRSVSWPSPSRAAGPLTEALITVRILTASRSGNHAGPS